MSKLEIRERHSLSKGHWFRFLPRKWQFWIMHIAVKLKLVRRYDRVSVTIHHDGIKRTTDKTVYGYNLIPDVGIKHLGDMLIGAETTDIDLAFIEPGEGSTAPVIGDIDVEDALEGSPHPARLPETNQTRSVTTPFEVEISAFVGSTDYTRPQTISELTVWFNDDPGTKMFARAILGAPVALTGTDTATLIYGIIFR